MTRIDRSNACTDSAPIKIFALGDRGIVSVGLKAVELVKET